MSWAVVTGASSAIGGACALQLARDGYDVIVHYLRHEHEAAQIAAQIDQLGVQAVLIRHRLDRKGDTQSFCEAVSAVTPEVEALIVASAAGVMRDVASLTEHHINWTLQTSALPILTAAKLLAPSAVVAISSLGSTRVVPHYAAIGVAKAAMEAAVRYLGVEMAPKCRVNAISAGLLRTRSAMQLPEFDAMQAATLANTPMKRLLVPQDIADLASFLISDKAAMITGSVIALDGGYGLRW